MTALALGCAWGVVAAWPLVVRAGSEPARARAVALGRRRVRSGGWAAVAGRAGVVRVLRAAGTVGRVAVGLATRRRRRAAAASVERAVPLALDVVTMALRAGGAPRHALAVAAPWCPVEVAGHLAAVERRCRLGAPFGESLGALAVAVPPLAPLAEVLALSDRDGAPAADRLAATALTVRADLRRRAEAHARRVSVHLLFPLVFLVLPAFGLLTVVPALADGLRGL